MKKLTIGLVALTATALIPSAARATGTTEGASSEVPPACTHVLDNVIVGPARATHGRPRGEDASLPNCDDVEGICVILTADSAPAGAARAVHSRPRGQDGPPCIPVDDSCNIYVNLDIDGPARAAHQARPAGPAPETITVEIPEACQEALSLAAFGSDSGTILWLGGLLVLAGGALLFTRRTALVRTR